MNILASATVDDGYNGDTCRVVLILKDGYILEMHNGGVHKGPLSQNADTTEALWRIENHPTGKARYRDVITFPVSP